MHRVIKNHFDNFVKKYNLAHTESMNFEAFSAYCIAKHFTFDNVNPEALVYEGDEPGIDSAFFICDEAIITSIDEINALFEKKKNNHDIVCVLIQSKTSETWNKKEINTFESAVLDFMSENSEHKYNEELNERKEVFNIIIKNVGKIKNGRPRIQCFFVNTANEASDSEILSAERTLKNRLDDTGLFFSSEASLIGREKLLAYWIKSQGAYETTFEIIGSASFPKSAGIEESYVVTISAKEFTSKVLTDENGSLRKSIFEENVRDFIPFDGSEINTEIGNTIRNEDRAQRFGIMNNGLTIISPDVRLQSNEIYISNYQIVNGCQTSNVLFENSEILNDKITIMAKIIETDDQDIVDDIVKSTNRQNKIEEHQFLATLDSVKAVERYFVARGGDEEHRLYFERRPNQYGRDDIPGIRIFDLKELARCTGAMFLDKPDVASRYPNQLVEELQGIVFDPRNKEEIFYTAAYCSYRLKLLHSNNRIDKILNRFKWYSLMAIRYMICGSAPANVTSAKVEKDCESIIDIISKNDETCIALCNDIARRFSTLAEVDRDRLRTTRFVSEVREAMA
ncbi:AIPR protein [Neorhizobium galegae bv. officinalis]|nr:AIPR protein [Neorhizobium galegae bv. officinalis]